MNLSFALFVRGRRVAVLEATTGALGARVRQLEAVLSEMDKVAQILARASDTETGLYGAERHAGGQPRQRHLQIVSGGE